MKPDNTILQLNELHYLIEASRLSKKVHYDKVGDFPAYTAEKTIWSDDEFQKIKDRIFELTNIKKK